MVPEGRGPGWLEIRRGRAPLIVSFPHTGTDIPPDIERRLVSPWLARKDADWWVHRLYDMAHGLDATTVRTSISRTVIDVNRDPSGASLYPGQTTTDLCPLTTFDGEPLYRTGREPDASEIATRRVEYFEPYHAALRAEVERLRAAQGCVVLYDAHSIRSQIPRLFDGVLPHFNIGTYDGRSCDPALADAVEHACADAVEHACADAVEHACADARFTRATNGRFKGGWTVRRYGEPARGIHAIQMELSCRSYLEEPDRVAPDNWPPDYDAARAKSVHGVLAGVLNVCLHFARTRSGAAP